MTNFHELNLDWLIHEIKKLSSDMNEFTALNTITFEGEWDITKSYKAWSIINDTNGNGYVSTIPVPYGIELDNTKYWQPISNYNALYAAYESRIASLESNMATTQSDVNKLKYNNLKNKNILCIGDSYNYGEGATSGNGWGHYIATYSGATVYSIKQPSGGYTKNGDSRSTYPNKTFEGAFDSWCLDNPTLLDQIDIVIVGGSTNDTAYPAVSYSDLRSAVNNLINKLKQKMPKVNIYGFPVWRPNYLLDESAFNKSTNAIALPYVQNGCGTSFYAPTWFINQPNAVGTNATHYSDWGYRYMAEYMLACINGWDGHIKAELWNPSSAVGSGKCSVHMDGYDVRMYIDLDNVTYSTGLLIVDFSDQFAPYKNTIIQGVFSVSGEPDKNITGYVNTQGKVYINRNTDTDGKVGRLLINAIYPLKTELY